MSGRVDVATRFGLQAGCRLSHTRFLCTPTRQVITGAKGVPVQSIAALGIQDPRVCYRANCGPSIPPSQAITDLFGAHTLTPIKTKLLCTPAGLGPPLPLRDGLDHVACYRSTDSLRLPAGPSVTADLLGLTVTGCKIKRSSLFCTSAATSNLQVNASPLLDLGGSRADVDRVCYATSCPKPFPAPVIVSDRFGSRTVTGLAPKIVCGPVAVPATSTTTVTSTTGTTTTLPPGTDQALVCQRAIESGGMAYALGMLRAIDGCTTAGQFSPLDQCLRGSAVGGALSNLVAQWTTGAAAPCTGVDLRTELGYPEQCTAAPTTCGTGATTDLSSVVGCLACGINAALTQAGVSLFANLPILGDPCRSSLGDGGLAVLGATLQQLDHCLQQPGATSVAACFAPDEAAWRSQSEGTCAGVDFVSTLGYSRQCSGVPPVVPGFCASEARPCTFGDLSLLSGPGPDDDLLDCLSCQAEEGVLAIGRTLHGANLCCIGGTCDRILTRFACRQAGGTAVRYRIDSAATGPVSIPHGIDVTRDGTLLIADGSRRVLKIPPGGSATVVASTASFPNGVASDAAGNIYVTSRCDHTVTKIAPDGSTSPFAGTSGVGGSSGDGGPAASALLSAPDGIAVDPAGNVYFTESGLLSIGCGSTAAGTERIRVVDPSGIIHTVAGSNLGVGGEGGPALGAQLEIPYGLRWGFVDGSLLIGEAGAQRALRVADGILTRIAGLPTSPIAAHSGYGGPASRARFYQLCGIGQDPDGNTILAPMEDNRIALVDSLGSVIAIAGTGRDSTAGSPSGDGGLAVIAQAGCPEDVVTAPDGRTYFSDLAASRIRVLTPEPF